MLRTSQNPAIRQTRIIFSAAKSLLKGKPQQESQNSEETIPQAVTQDSRVKVELRDWRKHFSDQLQGRGIEIGPLHRPMLKHDGMQIEYIDRCTVAELRKHYPELQKLPLVEPDIVGDAEIMEGVADEAYDFVISAHVVEHTKNPINSFKHWCRVTKPGGKIYLIVPDKRVIFDKKRVRTTLEHIILDYERPSAERDYEHYLDFSLHVHNKSGEVAIADADQLLKKDYSIHFHVFIPEDIVNLVEWFSENVQPLKILEGPVMSPGSDEFHLMLEVGAKI